jgi:nitrogen fixation protein NifQ
MLGETPSLYQILMDAPGGGNDFDRHAFAGILIAAGRDGERPLNEACGLSATELNRLLDTYFPTARFLMLGISAGAGRGDDAPEEPDLRKLLLDFRGDQAVETEWLATIIARRSLRPNHLWEDLGLSSRRDLAELMERHFRRLADRKPLDMRWKKFFYKQLCEADGLSVCKSPLCDICSDFRSCFGPEESV